jgi:hypothetical protein
MDKHNENKIISRIENVEEGDLNLYKHSGFRFYSGGCDYICKREDMTNLRGSRFKKKRTDINYFLKNYKFSYQKYRVRDKKEAISLYKHWMIERKVKYSDSIYQRLLEDNFNAFKVAVGNLSKLNLLAAKIILENKIQAVTFGYSLDKDNFVVLFEICNLKFKGIAQYIFSEFCRGQSQPNINIMDDSGLEGLKKVKLSYRPYKTIKNFVVTNG